MVNSNYLLGSTMEKFEPLLNFIQAKLQVVLSKNETQILSRDVANLKNTGADLIKLAEEEVHSHLAEVKNRVLYHTFKEEGLGIRTKTL